MPASGSLERRLAAVWFADLVGYTELSARDENRALKLVGLFQEVCRTVVRRYDGRLIKFIGDAALAEFRSTESAVRAAAALVQAFARQAPGGEGLRVGIHLGEVVPAADGDIYGDGVNVASRIHGVAEPGQVVVSEDAWRQLRRNPDIRFTALGEHTLKGIQEPIAVYAADLDVDEGADAAAAGSPPMPEPGAPAARSPRKVVLGVVLVAAALTAGYIASRPTDAPPARAETAAPAGPSAVAVLPFKNLSSQAENAYFADGIAGDILSHLGRIAELRVISRSTTARYRDTALSRIREELDVDAVVEGSVRREGDQLRITAYLTDARTGQSLWSETYDRGVADIFEVQSEIARKVAGALQASLSLAERERISRAPTRSVAAYDLFLRSRREMGRFNGDGQLEAIRLLRLARQMDPNFAAALALQAEASLYHHYWTGDPAWIDSSRSAVALALAADPDVPEGLYLRGVHLLRAGQPGTALSAFQRAVEIHPNYSQGHQGISDALAWLRRYPEALAAAERGAGLEPGFAFPFITVASRYREIGLYSEANLWYQRAIQIQPHVFMAHDALARSQLAGGDRRAAEQTVASIRAVEAAVAFRAEMVGELDLFLGRPEAAREVLSRGAAAAGPRASPTMLIGLGAALWTRDRAAATRHLAAAEAALSQQPATPERAWLLAQIRGIRGDAAGALPHLREALRGSWAIYQDARLHPALDPIRNDPAIGALLAATEQEVSRARRAVQAAPR